MSRNWSTEAIVLKTHRIGDNHKGVLLCTPFRGNISAIAHGAASQKGKLRNAALPFARGTVYLYEDKVHNSMKITDFDVTILPEGIRAQIQSFFAASIAAEIMLLGHVESESREMFDLFAACLDFLEGFAFEVTENPQRQVHPMSILALFLWNYLLFAGVCPDLDFCGTSGRKLLPDQQVYFSFLDTAFMHTPEKHDMSGHHLVLPPPSLTILQWVKEKPYTRTGKEALPSHTITPLYNLGIHLVQQFIGRKLNSVRTAAGMFRI